MNGLLTQQRQSTWQATKSILENYMFSTKNQEILRGRQHINPCTWRRESEIPYSKQYSWNCPRLTSSVVWIFIYLFIFVIYYLQSPTENSLGKWAPWINIIIVIIMMVHVSLIHQSIKLSPIALGA